MTTMLDRAKRYIGQKEVPGVGNNPWILALWSTAYSWLGTGDGSVAWCGLFMRKLALECGLPVPKAPYRAKSWLNWGYAISTPVKGCVAILGREGGGHVTLVDHIDQRGFLGCIGGNQGDAVKLSYFDPARVDGYRVPYPGFGTPLQVVTRASASVSRNEA